MGADPGGFAWAPDPAACLRCVCDRVRRELRPSRTRIYLDRVTSASWYSPAPSSSVTLRFASPGEMSTSAQPHFLHSIICSRRVAQKLDRELALCVAVSSEVWFEAEAVRGHRAALSY